MTLARNQLISIADTPYYHIMSRCVRRAFLCGTDHYSGNCYEHRRQMIVTRIKLLATAFNIDICSYAVMSNHYHLVLKANDTKTWSDKQCLIYWSQICSIPKDCQQYLQNVQLTKAQSKAVSVQASTYRKRLMNISWFMKLLNENIARRANLEDEVTGHFWEARFKSQALLDERALLTCMAYVDLNPIRAAMAKTPRDSDYTSIQARLIARAHNKQTNLLTLGLSDNDIPYTLDDYCDLVTATGRVVLANKRGYIPIELSAILQRLNFNTNTWLDEINRFTIHGHTAVGTIAQLKGFCSSVDKQWRTGIKLTPVLE